MIDLHTHVLPAVDDGPATMEEALAMIAAAAADGVTALAATPHVSPAYPTTGERMERELERLVAAVTARGIAIDVLPGGELDAGRVLELGPGELRRFALGGSAGYVLVEFPYVGWGSELLDALGCLEATGLRPVLAHPERNPNVQSRPASLEPLVAAGALVQLTAASVDGRFGRPAQETAFSLLASGLAHLLASDAHGSEGRRVGLRGARRRLRDDALGDWLTVEVPGAILAGGDLPARPRPARRRRPW